MIRISIVMITFLAVCSCTNSQSFSDNTGLNITEDVLTLEIWPKSALAANASVEAERPEPDRGDSVIRISNITDPTIMIFQSEKSQSKTPAVIICPGGGYDYLALNKEGTKIAKWFNSIGITGIVLKYRVPKQSDNAFKDIQRAMCVVRFNADQWKIDPDKIGCIGFSAGAHLCARLSGDFDNKSYDTVDEKDALSCRPDFTILMYLAGVIDNRNNLSREIKVSSKNPPAFIVQTQDDPVHVENSIYYYAALQKAKVPSEMHIFPSGGHGYGIEAGDSTVSIWPRLCEKWLRQNGIIE